MCWCFRFLDLDMMGCFQCLLLILQIHIIEYIGLFCWQFWISRFVSETQIGFQGFFESTFKGYVYRLQSVMLVMVQFYLSDTWEFQKSKYLNRTGSDVYFGSVGRHVWIIKHYQFQVVNGICVWGALWNVIGNCEVNLLI